MTDQILALGLRITLILFGSFQSIPSRSTLIPSQVRNIPQKSESELYATFYMNEVLKWFSTNFKQIVREVVYQLLNALKMRQLLIAMSWKTLVVCIVFILQ